MSGHALLSPSSAHRWLNCPLAPRLEAQLPAKTSEYAQEGTLAHSVCEIAAKKKFKKVKAAEYNKELKKLKAKPLWNDEMLNTAEVYVEHLSERAMQFEHEPYVAFEVGVDISEWVPEAFGRCDCIMIGGDTLVITDYKHGKGVPVDVEENPQLMLYALGALKLYTPIYGSAIKKFEICIDQPRLDSHNSWFWSVEELLAWGNEVKTKAQKAFMGLGEYHAGEWCRFCRANGMCKAQADQHLSAFEDFKDVTGGDKPYQMRRSAILTPAQMADVLERGKSLVAWYDSVKDIALETILAGEEVPGWKAVEGRSTREWSDQDKALETLQAAGVDRAVIYDNVPKSLAQLEKLLGKDKFNELVGSLVVKPRGKPALATIDDKRKNYNSAANDFAAVAQK